PIDSRHGRTPGPGAARPTPEGRPLGLDRWRPSPDRRHRPAPTAGTRLPRPAAPRPPLCMHCLGPDPDDGGLGRDLGVTTSPGPADGPRLVGADRLPSHVSVCGGRTG